uniref:CCHC-type domain-containing protein n=1 Tax=Chenopodium quinoa TaxID=63459 RepID=A0A803LSU2_CHEQI
MEPYAYLDWDREVERTFNHKKASDSKRFYFAILKLSKYASLWYETMQAKRLQDNKQQLESWQALKVKMRKRFVPRSYRKTLYNNLNSIQQKSWTTIEQYLKEFENLYMACTCKEEDEQKISRFLMGLERQIRHKVELMSYTTFDDVCLLASKVEKQQEDIQGNSSRFDCKHKQDNTLATTPHIEELKHEQGHTQNKIREDETVASFNPKLYVDRNSAKKTICFKCQGQGHISRDCPNKFLITKKEHVFCIEQRKHELEDGDDDKGDNEEEIVECYEESETNMLLDSEFVWLDDEAENQYYSRGYAEPLVDGSYQIVKTMGNGKYKVMLGNNNKPTFHAKNLISYFDNDNPP